MRRLVVSVVLSIGMLTGCGGTDEVATPEPLGEAEQGLACKYPEMSCPSGSVCILDDADPFFELCRQRCPSTGVCPSGSRCRVTPDGSQKYC
jgi:hypothetical protein